MTSVWGAPGSAERSFAERVLSAATTALYQANPFRVLGTDVSASSRELRRVEERLRLTERLGTGVLPQPDVLGLVGKPESHIVRDAVAEVFENARALGDGNNREHATPVDVGIAYFDER